MLLSLKLQRAFERKKEATGQSRQGGTLVERKG